MSDCIFCKIVNGEIPCHKVWEDENVLAFLDLNPATKGHVLVIPKKHLENIFDTDEITLGKMMKACREVSLLLKNNFGATGIQFVNNSGKDAEQAVDHIHFHVIPRFGNKNFELTLVGDKKPSKNFEEVLKKIKGEAPKGVPENRSEQK